MGNDDLIKLASRLARYSGEDETTGLRNLRQFLREAERELARCRRTGEDLTLLAVEADSGVTTTEVADRVKECIREEDLVARIGSRVFGLLVAASSERTSAEVLQAHLHPVTTLSVGERRVEWQDVVSTPVTSLLQDALAALDWAKQSGGNCHMLWRDQGWAVH